jgi:hypothetical protein
MISMNKYRSEIEKISVTPEIEDRILRNLSSKKNSAKEMKRQPHISWMRRAGFLAASCAIALCAFLLNPSIISSDWGKKPAHNSEGNVVQSEMPRTQAPESSTNSGGSTTKPGGLQTQAPVSSSNSGGSTTKPGGLQTQAPVSSTNSGENSGQAEGSPFVNAKGIAELKKAVSFTLFIPKNLPSGYKIDDTSVITGEVAQIIYSDGSNKIIFRTARGSDDISGDYTSYEKSDVVRIGDTTATLKGNNLSINLVIWIKDGCSYSLTFSLGVEKDTAVSIIENMTKV